MDTLKTVCVSTYNTPAQKSPTAIRTPRATARKYTLAQTKYTMMLRFVSWTASHTLVRPVSS